MISAASHSHAKRLKTRTLRHSLAPPVICLGNQAGVRRTAFPDTVRQDR
jgi:hypothetical protein